MSLLSNKNVAEETRNMIPWIVWYLWKTRNGIIFEGKAFVAHDVVSKISEEAEFWCMAQKLEKEKEEEERKSREMVQKRWERPCAGWLKCNIGVDFNKQNSKKTRRAKCCYIVAEFFPTLIPWMKLNFKVYYG
ncbi:unnamed protein product, partial [Brassica rapa]